MDERTYEDINNAIYDISRFVNTYRTIIERRNRAAKIKNKYSNPKDEEDTVKRSAEIDLEILKFLAGYNGKYHSYSIEELENLSYGQIGHVTSRVIENILKNEGKEELNDIARRYETAKLKELSNLIDNMDKGTKEDPVIEDSVIDIPTDENDYKEEMNYHLILSKLKKGLFDDLNGVEIYKDKSQKIYKRLQAKNIKFNKGYWYNIFHQYGDNKSNRAYNVASITKGLFSSAALFFKKRAIVTKKQKNLAEEIKKRVDKLTDEELEELYANRNHWLVSCSEPKILVSYISEKLVPYEEKHATKIQEEIDKRVEELVTIKNKVEEINNLPYDANLLAEKNKLLSGCKQRILDIQELLSIGSNIFNRDMVEDARAYSTNMSRKGRRFSRVGITDDETLGQLLRIVRSKRTTEEQALNAYFDYVGNIKKGTKTSNGWIGIGSGEIATGTTLNGDNYYNVLNRRYDYRDDTLTSDIFSSIMTFVGIASTALGVISSIKQYNAIKQYNIEVDRINRHNMAYQNQVESSTNSLLNSNSELSGYSAGLSESLRGELGVHGAHRGFGVADQTAHNDFATITSDFQKMNNAIVNGNNSSLFVVRESQQLLERSTQSLNQTLSSYIPNMKRYAQASTAFNYAGDFGTANIVKAFSNISADQVKALVEAEQVLNSGVELFDKISLMPLYVRIPVISNCVLIAALANMNKKVEKNIDKVPQSKADKLMEEYMASKDIEQNKVLPEEKGYSM